jgi:SWI/SNF-related matrix-associated actin-dependent regulator 1 of chromatin subfamily A
MNFDYLLPAGETLFDFQTSGVAYITAATAGGKGALLGDEMGLGKTRQVITAMLLRAAQLDGCKKCLVIVKASLKGVWERELQRLAPQWTCQVLQGTKPYGIISRVAIINYDILAAWKDALDQEQFDTLVIDESHYCKNAKAQRTQAAVNLSHAIRARRGMVVLLTGTPINNRPIELLTQLKIMGRVEEVTPKPYDGRSWDKAFKGTYCWNPSTQSYDGARNLDRLNQQSRASFLVRRLRHDVLGMEDTRRFPVPLSLNGGLDNYHHIERTFKAVDYRSYYIELLTALRAEAGRAKVDAAVTWIEDFQEENEGHKLVVWAWHIDVQVNLAAKLNAKGIKTILWREAGSDKNKIMAMVDAFNEGDAKVIVCSLQGKIEGQTLVGNGHNCTDVLFCEQPWHPGTVSQAQDRIARIGQCEPTFAHTLLASDTVDEWLAELIDKKWGIFRATVDGRIVSQDEDEAEITQELIRRLREAFPGRDKKEDE